LERISKKDLKKGFSGEVDSYHQILQYGYAENLTFHNNLNYKDWKHKLQKGVDFILETEFFVFLIENSYCSYNYPYRTQWFLDSRVPRFEHALQYQQEHLRHGKPIIRIILTNRPQNFKSVQQIAESKRISVMDVKTLINYIDYTTNLLSTITNSNNSNNSNNTCTGQDCFNVKIEEKELSIMNIKHPQHKQWLNAELERLEKADKFKEIDVYSLLA
jgi:hypothetical protein